MIYCRPHALSNCLQCVIDKQNKQNAEATNRSRYRLNQKDMVIKELTDSLHEVTNHFIDVMEGDLITGQGIIFDNGVNNIPTIKRALDVLAKVSMGDK